MGRQSLSVRAWILVVRPPRERPIAWLRSPFAARGAAMRLHSGRVDQYLSRRPASSGQGMKQIRPDAFGGPALETVVQRLVRPVGRRRILPPTAGYQNMNDTADDAAIIDAGLAAGVTRQMALKPRKLGVGQPEKIAIQRRSPSGDLESRHGKSGNPIYGS